MYCWGRKEKHTVSKQHWTTDSAAAAIFFCFTWLNTFAPRNNPLKFVPLLTSHEWMGSLNVLLLTKICEKSSMSETSKSLISPCDLSPSFWKTLIHWINSSRDWGWLAGVSRTVLEEDMIDYNWSVRNRPVVPIISSWYFPESENLKEEEEEEPYLE